MTDFWANFWYTDNGRTLLIWGSFLACAVVMVMEPILAKRRQKNIMRSLRRERIANELEKETP